ncbi:MAG: hypothetical protein ACT4PM_11055 [Gemmatimonadales bacterium]
MIIVTAFLAASACSPRVGERPEQPIPVGGNPPVPSGSVEGSLGTRGAAGGGSRLTCKTSRIPSGWIAVDYVVAGECQPAPNERYNGMVLIQHAGYAAGTVLVVCSDQPIPRGWYRHSGTEGAGEDQCPSSASPRPLAERVMRIGKQYR